MNTSEATSQAIKLLPNHSIRCQEEYHSVTVDDYRVEGIECMISVLPSIEGKEPVQSFPAPSFEACLLKISQTLRGIQISTLYAP